MEAVLAKSARKKKSSKVPDYLIKEVIAGIPFYYKGYREVMKGTITKEEIMGCSGLQSIIIEYLLFEVCAKLNRKKYRILTNEPGNHLSHNSNLSYDIAIIEKRVLTPDKITRKYVDVPPYLVVEVDVRVDLKDTGFTGIEEFVFFKTDEAFRFGVQKFIWILSRIKKLVIAENGKPWQIVDWDTDMEFQDGISFNVAKYLAEEGIDPAV